MRCCEALSPDAPGRAHFCRGHLLNKDGRAAGIIPRDLWTGPAARTTRYASEELIEFWALNPRLTRTQYIDARAAAHRAERLDLAS